MTRPTNLPSRVGRYEILGPLARGGMAEVVVARATGIGGFERPVAIKLVHGYLSDEAFERDLLEEAKLCARLRHPNIVSVIDVGEESGRMYLVMDYVEGESMAGLARAASRSGRPIPAAIGLRMMLDLLAALHHAHELRDESGHALDVVHRDVSPQNLLIGTDGIARLADFGIARAASRPSATASGTLKGKFSYMSPEQAAAAPVDRRTDVWAAGVMLWELLAGARLFTGESQEILLRIHTSVPPRISSVVPGVPRSLDDAVASALEPRLEHRCTTARALATKIMDAAKEGTDVASHDQVADYVRSLAEPQLRERHELIVRAGARARASLGSIPSEAPTRNEANAETPRMDPTMRNADGTSTGATAPVSSVSAPSPATATKPSWRRWGLVAMGIAGGGALAVLVVRPPTKEVASSAPVSSAGPAAFVPAEVPSAVPPSAPTRSGLAVVSGSASGLPIKTKPAAQPIRPRAPATTGGFLTSPYPEQK